MCLFCGPICLEGVRPTDPVCVLSLLSVWLCCLMVFRIIILLRMCSGRSLCVLRILPCGMLCLSAFRMMFVSILLAVCGLSVSAVFSSAASISSVYSVQRAFL